MKVKSLIQFLILISIILIIGGVYLKYFDTKKNNLEEINSLETQNKEQLEKLEKQIVDLELKNSELIKKINESKIQEYENVNNKELNIEDKKININKINKIEDEKININKIDKVEENKIKENKRIVKNLVKDVEYTSIDEKGNKFHLLATSGKSNIENNDILDLENVRGKITSEKRDTIYIVSDFAQYNTINLNSKFYENVIINYQDKEITCINFDINMQTNKAIAYNDVIVTDPNSVMKAGIVEFDLKTKNLNINPESVTDEINVITN